MSLAGRREARRTPTRKPRFSIEAANQENAILNFLTAAVVAIGAGGLYVYLRLQLSPAAWDFGNGREFNPLVLFPYFIGLVAAYLLGRALLDTARVRKFGTSLLETDDLFILGRTSHAVIRTAWNLDVRSDYRLRLVCIERTITRDFARRGGTRIHDRKVWESVRSVDRSTIDSSVGIPVEFDIPGDAPRATWPPPEDEAGVRWALEVQAPTPGLNYQAVFRLNVQDARSARRYMEEDEREAGDEADASAETKSRLPWFAPWVITAFILPVVARPDYGDLADAVLARAGLAKALHGEDPAKRLDDALQGTPSRRAALAVRRLIASGMTLDAARPVLAESLRSISSSQGVASQDLGMAGSAAVPWLAAMLESGSARVRQDAAAALGDIGPAAGSAIPALTSLAARTPPDASTIAAASALTSIRRTGVARLWHEVPFQAVFFLGLAVLFLAYALLKLSQPGTAILARLRIRQDTPARFLALVALAAAACLAFSSSDLLGAQWTLPADAWALCLGTALLAAALHDLANRRDHAPGSTGAGP